MIAAERNKVGLPALLIAFKSPRHSDNLAKEGAKYHIGMVYSTQSVTSVSKDLLAQTENFFIVHLASQDEVNALAKVNIAYDSLKEDLMQTKTPGYVRMLTRSHRFVVPMQARKFEASSPMQFKMAKA